METENKTAITVEATINAPLEKVWTCWTEPQHITNWTFATDEWHAPYAENDLREDGKFKTTMAAKDGSMSFDFEGVYTLVKEHEVIEYTILDGRKVSIRFVKDGDGTRIVETFEAEETFPVEVQQGGWQAILDNFKKYTEAQSS